MEQKGDAPEYQKYFSELLQEMRHVNRLRAVHPSQLHHAATLLTAEITRIWNIIYCGDTETEDTESDMDETVRLQEKIPIPDYPSGRDEQGRKCNLVGRILGPSGLSVRQLEAETGCEIVIRGHGSVKDSQKQERLRGQPGWEHLDEPLHVVVTATEVGRKACEMKLLAATKLVRKLLQPGNDEYKKRQLVQLAIMKGTYRPDRRPDN